MGTSLTSQLRVSLIDDVSKPARTVAQALKQAEAQMKNVGKAMGGSGSNMGVAFKKQLAGLNLTKKELAQVRLEWMRYSAAQKQALGSDWMSKNAAGVRAWKSQTIGALRAVRAERMKERAALAKAAAGGVAGEGFMSGAMMAAPGAAGMAAFMSPAAAAGMATVGGAGYGIKKAADYEKAFVEVKKKLDMGGPAGEAAMHRLISEQALRTGTSRVDIAGQMAEGGAAGVSMKDMEGFLTVASKAAVAFDMNSREIGKYFGQIKAQTQWSNAEMEVFVDKVNALADAGATSEASIVQMFQRASESGKAAGVKLDTSLAALSALNSVGMDESTASTMWGQFTSKLATIDLKSKGKDFKALGMDLAQFKKNFSKDSTSAIIDLLTHLQNFKGNKAEILQSLFGKQWWDEVARAGNALPEILKNLNLINDPSKYKGGAGNAFDLQMGTTYAKMEQVKVLAEEVAAALLGWTLDPIKDGLQGVLDAAKAIEKVINLFKGQGTASGGNFMEMAGQEGGKLWRDTTTAVKSKWQSAKDWWSGTKPQAQQQSLPMMAQMQSASPTVDVKGLDAAKAGLTEVKSGLDAVGATSANPQVNAGSINAANEAARSLLQTLQAIPGAAASAGSAAQAAASKVSSLRSLSATSFAASGDAAGAR